MQFFKVSILPATIAQVVRICETLPDQENDVCYLGFYASEDSCCVYYDCFNDCTYVTLRCDEIPWAPGFYYHFDFAAQTCVRPSDTNCSGKKDFVLIAECICSYT